jgi:hypothetical protein
MICKTRLCHVFGLIVEQANSVSIPSYSEALDLDSCLRDVYSLIPPFLLIRPLDQSITDNPNLIMQRFNLILLFHKSRCVLHRKYLTKEDPLSQFSYSRSACIDSALQLLHYQTVINDAIHPGGPLSRDRWFLTTLAAHDFLMGAMIIYLALAHKVEANSDIGQNFPGLRANNEENMFHQLEISYEIWKKSPREARDAKKASGVLEIMIRNAGRRLYPKEHESWTPDEPPSSNANMEFPCSNNENLGIGRTEQHDQIVPVASGLMEDLETLIDMPDNLDWVG